ncbi:tetratricopeptide repeat protein, partial [Nocardia sp. NPDC003482]
MADVCDPAQPSSGGFGGWLHRVRAGRDITVTTNHHHYRTVATGHSPHRVIGQIPQQPKHFVIRPQLDMIRTMVGRSPLVVIATGMRGVGKTQLAAAIAREKIGARSGLVAWVDAETVETAQAGLAEVAERLGVADPDGDPLVSARRLRDHLSARSEPGLLVFDNATDPDQIRALLPAAGGTRVLITTIDHAFTALGESIDIDHYKREESVRFLSAATGLADTTAAALIAESLGDLPLALAAAAATISGRRLDYTRYQTLLTERRLPDVLARRAGQDYPRSVVQAILLSIDTVTIRTADPGLDRTVTWLLGVMAMLSPAGVRRAVLPDNEGRLDEALERCAAASLLSWSTDGHSMIMHQLVARVLREYAQSIGEANILVEAAVTVIEPHLFEANFAWERRQEGVDLIDQIDAIWQVGLPAATPELAERMCELRLWGTRQLTESVNLTRALTFGHDTYSSCERIFGPDHPCTLGSRNDLATIYHSAGQLDEAISLHETALRDQERVLGPEHPDTVISRNNLAVAYQSAGQLDKAIPLLEGILCDWGRVLGPEHPATLASCHNLATAYQLAGQFDKAIVLLQTALDERAKIFGADHAQTLSCHSTLASTYQSAGNLSKAISLHETTLRDRERVLGSDHP